MPVNISWVEAIAAIGRETDLTENDLIEEVLHKRIHAEWPGRRSVAQFGSYTSPIWTDPQARVELSVRQADLMSLIEMHRRCRSVIAAALEAPSKPAKPAAPAEPPGQPGRPSKEGEVHGYFADKEVTPRMKRVAMRELNILDKKTLNKHLKTLPPKDAQ